MKSVDFAYWLQGFFELQNPKSLDERQTELIRRHLALVFKHEIDPSAGPPEHQKELDAIHSPSGTAVNPYIDPNKKWPDHTGAPPGVTYRC